ncbi:molybdopterin/thiamine biosynthesis adenylyltransferase [Scopulibacillus daqui]|uniref:Molybdopterin/thiamine biosynthesis adenylyltransferase n=1 Tax=Scopulibacillus daqui TaxID=1469162 RepID=A0ABS2PZ64_9BACL|nr:ThiF family adenylyltransferase [Scopulibacillus daqui]MBM7644587.1 molybdopterin/thiamine biosynthesis adenylyltransferase [Scopulibacillus daqui]
MVKPKFKETIPVFFVNNEIHIGEEDGIAGIIEDPNGSIKYLISLIDGENTIEDIIEKVILKYPYITSEDINSALGSLDAENYLEDNAKRPKIMGEYEIERYKANLNYFSLFTSLNDSKFDIQEKIMNTNVALLGVGGLGSQILYHLAGLGFHNINILDFDTLELSNFNRQLLYSEENINELKTELAKKRISKFNPNVNLNMTNKRIECADDVMNHIKDSDFVICVADKPTMHIQDWVNEAVVKLRKPLVSGGVLNTRGRFYSIIPGKTGCVECHKKTLMDSDQSVNEELNNMNQVNFQRNNAAISSNVAMLAGAMVNELLGLVTGISEPRSLGRMIEIDYLTYQTYAISEWEKQDSCPVCQSIYSK